MTDGPPPATLSVTIHESARPHLAAERLRAELEVRRVPGRFLYQAPGQAERWLAYHEAWSPSRADPAMAALYRAAFAAALDRWARGPFTLVGLGSGGGRKDGDLLTLAAERGLAATYLPLDGAAELALASAQHAAARLPELPVHPLVADLGASPDLAQWLDGHGAAPRLFTCFGMVPNFDAREFPAYLRTLLRPCDVLLISANLSPGLMGEALDAIVPQYDNPPARAWYEGALAALAVAPRDYRLTVEARGAGEDADFWRIVVTATMERPVTLRAEGVEMPMRTGEALEVFFSNRWTEPAFRAVLAEAGLACRDSWAHRSGEEAIFLCGVE